MGVENRLLFLFFRPPAQDTLILAIEQGLTWKRQREMILGVKMRPPKLTPFVVKGEVIYISRACARNRGADDRLGKFYVERGGTKIQRTKPENGLDSADGRRTVWNGETRGGVG